MQIGWGRYRNQCWSLLPWIARALLYSSSSSLCCISLRLCISFVSACLFCVSGNLFVSLFVLWISLIHKSLRQRTSKRLCFSFCLPFIPSFAFSVFWWCWTSSNMNSQHEMWLGHQRRSWGCREDRGQKKNIYETSKANQVKGKVMYSCTIRYGCWFLFVYLCFCVRVLIKILMMTAVSWERRNSDTEAEHLVFFVKCFDYMRIIHKHSIKIS